MNREEDIKYATEQFKDHVATFKQLDEYTQEIEFKKPGTQYYHIRFLLSRDYIFVCGDLGEAVYQLTEQAQIDRIASGYSMGYFTGKLRTVSGKKYAFNSQIAIEQIQKDMNGYEEERLTPEVKEFYQELITIAQRCSSNEEWSMELVRREEELNEGISDWWEWLPDVGAQLDRCLILYWVALKMAAKQLGYNVKFFD